MTLKEIYSEKTDKTVISFEIFPPKNDDSGEKLDKVISHLEILKKYNPAFISVTYGAGGTTQNTSLNIVKRVQNELNLNVMPHFTCVGSSKEHVRKYLMEVQEIGIKKILALRGDIPEGMEQKNFDFKYANELVEFIKENTDLSIGVAGYPEGHMECEDININLENLKRKINSGAEAIFTQMFFDNEKLFKFRDDLDKLGVKIPLIAGILPIRSFSQLEKMLTMAKVVVPSKLMDKLEKYKDNADDVKKIGIDFATEQCAQLIEEGINGLHFYTLNTSSSVAPILSNLNTYYSVNQLL